MKVFFNLLKAIAVFYWVLAAGLFTSMIFFPNAIDSLYSGYSGFVELVDGEVVVEDDEVTCLAITPECGWEFSLQSEPVQSYTETPIFEVEPVIGDMYILVDDNDDLFYSLFVYEELATPGVCEDDPQTDEDECPVIATFGWVEYQVSIVEPVEFTEDSVWYNVETGELFTAILVQSISEPSIVLGPLTREEFVIALETLLVYSSVVMVPYTFLAFSIGSRFSTSIAKEKSVGSKKEPKQNVKSSAKTVGLTNITLK
jgi:hypothetical protein